MCATLVQGQPAAVVGLVIQGHDDGTLETFAAHRIPAGLAIDLYHDRRAVALVLIERTPVVPIDLRLRRDERIATTHAAQMRTPAMG